MSVGWTVREGKMQNKAKKFFSFNKTVAIINGVGKGIYNGKAASSAMFGWPILKETGLKKFGWRQGGFEPAVWIAPCPSGGMDRVRRRCGAEYNRDGLRHSGGG